MFAGAGDYYLNFASEFDQPESRSEIEVTIVKKLGNPLMHFIAGLCIFVWIWFRRFDLDFRFNDVDTKLQKEMIQSAPLFNRELVDNPGMGDICRHPMVIAFFILLMVLGFVALLY